ncbi:hypothetical protein E2C01_096046 [Portunus trituberculatus]|uniref:Uncharacterized protein n=1 Tax=Portunus trituberculatus TaxID=210409 RepID=A0A5B7K0Z8_PORTR|nr:hypothetical protein [Portunus trituberculatus]
MESLPYSCIPEKRVYTTRPGHCKPKTTGSGDQLFLGPTALHRSSTASRVCVCVCGKCMWFCVKESYLLRAGCDCPHEL